MDIDTLTADFEAPLTSGTLPNCATCAYYLESRPQPETMGAGTCRRYPAPLPKMGNGSCGEHSSLIHLTDVRHVRGRVRVEVETPAIEPEPAKSTTSKRR